MSDLIWYLIGAMGLAIVAVLLLATRRSDEFSIARSETIDATPSAVFPLINSPRQMNTWMPFLEPDPNAEVVYSDPAAGLGAKSRWKGNSKVGAGNLEIVESDEPSRVALKLNMIKPMKASNDVLFTLEPVGDGTRVTWAMSGKQPYMMKVMSLFTNCDDMVGPQFEKGLAQLKRLSEA